MCDSLFSLLRGYTSLNAWLPLQSHHFSYVVSIFNWKITKQMLYLLMNICVKHHILTTLLKTNFIIYILKVEI